MSSASLDARLTTASFLAVLCLPALVGLFAARGELSSTEQRRLAAPPRIEWSAGGLARLPRDLERYADDHLGLRDDLIRAWAWLHIEALGVSPSEKLLVGRDGWFFFGDDSAIAQARGVAHFDDAELDRWVDVVAARHAWLAERDIAFLLVLVPNKHRLYAEHLPRALRPVHPRSQLDQLALRLEAEGLPVLDLRPVLEAASRRERVYHKTDTHWNAVGAYEAYRAILRALEGGRPSLAPLEPVAVRRYERTQPGLGLPRIVGLSTAYPEHSIELAVARPRAAPTPTRRARIEERLRRQLPFQIGTGDPGEPEALVFHDSFAEALVPYLAESFSRVSFVWESDLIPSVVEAARPDVVIHEIAERFLAREPRGLREAEAARARGVGRAR